MTAPTINATDGRQEFTSSTRSTSSATLSCTNTGSGLIVVAIGCQRETGSGSAEATPTSVTYNGTALTLAVKSDQEQVADYQTSSWDPSSSFWYLQNPDTGTNDLVITFGQDVASYVVQFMPIDNFDTTDPIGNSASSDNFWRAHDDLDVFVKASSVDSLLLGFSNHRGADQHPVSISTNSDASYIDSDTTGDTSIYTDSSWLLSQVASSDGTSLYSLGHDTNQSPSGVYYRVGASIEVKSDAGTPVTFYNVYYDSGSTPGTSATSFSQNINGGDRYILYVAALGTTATSSVPTSVTRNGVSATLITSDVYNGGSTAGLSLSWWYIDIPTSATVGFDLTFSANVDAWAIRAIRPSNESQSDMIGAVSTLGQINQSDVAVLPLVAEASNSGILGAAAFTAPDTVNIYQYGDSDAIGPLDTGSDAAADFSSHSWNYETGTTAGQLYTDVLYRTNSGVRMAARSIVEINSSTATTTTVEPTTGTLTLTGYAPTIEKVVSPATGSLTLTGYAPTVSVITPTVTTVSMTTGTLTLTGYAPTVYVTETDTSATWTDSVTGYDGITFHSGGYLLTNSGKLLVVHGDYSATNEWDNQPSWQLLTHSGSILTTHSGARITGHGNYETTTWTDVT